MYEHLDLRQDGDVVWATMNRPERLNALNRKLVAMAPVGLVTSPNCWSWS